MIYVSTGGFSQLTVPEAIEELSGFNAIEISAGSFSTEQNKHIKHKAKNCDILLHHYSPPPEIPFVLNLGSLQTDIEEKSYDFIKNSLELSADIGAKIYAIHAAYCFDPQPAQMGKTLSSRYMNDYNKVLNKFVSNYSKLQELGSKIGVRLLIENNVLSHKNNINLGKNSLLFTDCAGAEQLIKKTQGGVEFLIDLAHLKVSANSLGFNEKLFLEICKKHSAAFHLSDTSKSTDDNLKINKTSDLFEWSHYWIDCEFVTLEIYDNVDAIKESYQNVRAHTCGRTNFKPS